MIFTAKSHSIYLGSKTLLIDKYVIEDFLLILV